MRDPKRIDTFCEELKKMWHKVPDWRFGQLMSNFLGDVYSKTGRDIFFIEDDEMVELVKKYTEEKSDRENTERIEYGRETD